MRKAIGLALALAWLALPAHAQFMPLGVAAPQAGGGGGGPPTIHGTAVKADSNNTQGICPTLTTTVATTLYIAAHSGQPGVGPAPLVSGVANTGPATLSWGVLTRAGGHDANIRDPTAAGGSGTSQILTIWRARAASPGAYDITITWNLDVDAGSVICWAVAGDNATNPQDANTSLSVTALGPAAPPTVTGFSTTAANALLVFAQASYSAGACGASAVATPPSGWTKLLDNYDVGGSANYSCLEVDYKSVTAAQSGITIVSGNTAGSQLNYLNWSAIGTALVP